MSADRRRLLVGIVLHTDAPALHATLDALAAATRGDDRIVLLPDGPDAAMRSMLGGDPRLRSLPQWSSDQPLGTAAAFNRLAAGRTDVEGAVVLVENGARPAPDALDRLARALDRPDVGLAGPSTDDAWNEQRVALGPEPPDPASIAADLLERHGDGHRSLAPLHSVAELCMAASTEVLTAVGAADEGFGLGPCWEMEYAARAARAGLPAVWVPAAFVLRAPPTRRRLDAEATWFTASRRRYQDRLCGLRLRGARADHSDHCDGEACPHFAPTEEIVVHLPLPTPGRGRGPTRPPAAPLPVARPRGEAQVRGADADLVSCIMPTADRPAWVARAIDWFHRQDHRRRELIVVDDGDGDLRVDLGERLDHPDIVHMRLAGRASIGAKRNLGCDRARGGLLLQWDDDDWYGPGRISRQVAPILDGVADITGLRDAVWFDVDAWRFRRPTVEAHRRLFVGDVHGGTLAFGRSVWERGARYPDASLAEDAWFLREALGRGARLARLPASGVYLYVRHRRNSWQLGRAGEAAGEWDDVDEPLELAGDRDRYAPSSRAAPVEPVPWRPVVSCIMPTADRLEFLPSAIAGFLGQRFDRAELIVLDDGAESAEHLVPSDPRITFRRVEGSMVLGDKRNQAVEMARGEVVVHLDDDDWSHPDRLRVQVDALREGADVCGLDRMLWWDPRRRAAWRYACPPMRRPWVAGNTLAYRRATWERSPFPSQAVGEDTAFVWGLPNREVRPLTDDRLVIGTLHDRNTSTKHTRSAAWTPVDAREVLAILDGAGVAEPWAS